MVTFRSHDAGLLTGVKATSYARRSRRSPRRERRGADDALYLGEGETVLEATMSNIWWRDGEVLVDAVARDRRPPRRDARGGARLAREAGYRVREGSSRSPALLRGRGGVHELGGARDHARDRDRRARAPTRRGRRTACRRSSSRQADE